MINFIYTTAGGNKYPLEIFYASTLGKQICYQPDAIRKLCRVGCSNYGVGGGCPPKAPLFEDMVNADDQVILICSLFRSEHKPEKVKQSNNIAIHWKFQDGILARLLKKIGENLQNAFGGTFLATGYCMGCPGKRCSFKLGEEVCRNPGKRTYSMEATGINVVETVNAAFGIPFHWYTKRNTDIPYMLKCIAFIPKEKIEDKVFKDFLCQSLT